MRIGLPDILPVASIPGISIRAGGESRLGTDVGLHDVLHCSRLGLGRGLMTTTMMMMMMMTVLMLIGLGRRSWDGEDTVLIAREDLPPGNDISLACAGEGMAEGGIGGIDVFGNLSLGDEVAGGLLPGQELGQLMDRVPPPQAVLPGPRADGGARGGERRIVVDKDNVRHFLFSVVSSTCTLPLSHTHSLSLSLLSSPRPDTRRLTGAVNELTALTGMGWEMGDDKMRIPGTRYI